MEQCAFDPLKDDLAARTLRLFLHDFTIFQNDTRKRDLLVTFQQIFFLESFHIATNVPASVGMSVTRLP